jgi:long-subunit acyl-CoA synthetase (AMP-forming)
MHLMIHLSNNTFKHPNSFIDTSPDYNIFHRINDNDSPLTERLTFHQFIATTCDLYIRLRESSNRYVYSSFNDERYILIAIAGMLSGKTVLTQDDRHTQDILHIDSISIIDSNDYKETLNEINERIINKRVGCMLFYTSGSTGTPQPVRLSWYNIVVAILSILNDPYIDYSGYESVLHCLPHSHIYGFLMELLFIVFNKRMYYTTPSNLYQSYLTIKPSAIPIVPAILNKFYEMRLPLHLKLLICAGAPLRTDIAEFYGKTCRQILKGYGTTESTACLTLSTNPNDDGICTAANIIRIADDGELLVKGLSVSRDYVGDDNWYHTNDIVSIDSSGRIHIIGRKNNIIKLQQGEFINLDELSILYTTNSVDTVVYATPMDRYPRAIVYVDDNNNSDDITDLFNTIHKRNNRKGFERITDIIIRNIKDMPLKNGIRPDYKRIRDEAIARSIHH